MKTITIPKYVLNGLLLCLVLVIVLFFFAMKDGNQCLRNPMVYGAEKAFDNDIGGIMCSCEFLNPLYSPLYFDDKEMSTEPFFFDYNVSGGVSDVS